MFTTKWKKVLTSATFLTAAIVVAGCESKESKAIKFADSGIAYIAEGDFERANIQFNNALFNDATNTTALRGAAQLAGEQKNFIRQGRMLIRLLQIEPDDIDANNDFARLSMLGNDVTRAQEHANRVLAIEPNNISALTTLGASLVLEGKSAEAREILDRALSIDSNNPEIFNLYAAQSIREGDIDKAIKILDDGIAKVENPETLLVVRLVLADQHLNEAEVLSTFDQLIAFAPTNGSYRQKLAEYVMMERQDFSKARALFTEAIPYMENPTEVYTRIVAIDQATDGKDAAEATLKKFLAEAPNNIELRFLLPAFYCQSQEFEKCGAAFEALNNDPTLDQDQKLRALNGTADVAIVERDFERAEKIATQILTLDAKDAGALITRAQIQLNNDNPTGAIESLRTALASEPDNAEGLVFLALAYEQSDQSNFADAQFARALDQSDYTKPVVDQYRAFLIRNNDFDRSMEILDRYLRANPGDQEALLQRAQGAIAQGDFLEAEASARTLITNSGTDLRAGSILAQSLFSQDRFVDALSIAEEVLENNPDDPGNKILRASILQKLGRSDEIISELREKINTSDAQSIDYALLGDLLNDTRDHAAARRVSIEGLQKFPQAEQLYVLAYIAESRMGNTSGGTALLRDGISKAQNNAQLRTLLSNELINSRRFDEAITVLQSLEEDNALSPITANNLASLLLEQEGSEEAALSVARLLEGSENPYFADTLAWAYYKAGQIQNAVRYTNIAAVGLPSNADVLYHQGMINIAVGNNEKARKALEQAKENHDATSQTSIQAIDKALATL